MLPRPRVVYIVGEGRSGSTLLGDLLGQVEGFFHAGEVDHLWTSLETGRSLIPCSCGDAASDCAIWSEVIGRLRASDDAVLGGLARWSRDVGRIRRLRTLLSGARAIEREPAAAAYADLLARTYATIADVTSARVVVDSSKHPAEALLACAHPDVEAFAIHLVRDPRAVLHSRLRLATWRADAPAARNRTTAYRVARWSARNGLAEWVCRSCATGRSVRIRYEDLVAEPDESMRVLLDALGERGTRRPPIHGNTVEFAPSHVLAGNLTKFRAGSVEVKEDPRWRAALTPRERLIGTVVAFPLLTRYGYPLRVRAGALRPPNSQ